MEYGTLSPMRNWRGKSTFVDPRLLRNISNKYVSVDEEETNDEQEEEMSKKKYNFVKEAVQEAAKGFKGKVGELEALCREWKFLSEDLEKKRVEFEPIFEAQRRAVAPYEEKLGEMESKVGLLEKTIEVLLDKSGKVQLRVDNIVAEIMEVLKFKRIEPGWKGLWAQALEKVNDATRKILEELVEAEKEAKRQQKVKKFSIRTEVGIFGNLYLVFRELAAGLRSWLGNVSEAADELEDGVKKALRNKDRF